MSIGAIGAQPVHMHSHQYGAVASTRGPREGSPGEEATERVPEPDDLNRAGTQKPQAIAGGHTGTRINLLA